MRRTVRRAKPPLHGAQGLVAAFASLPTITNAKGDYALTFDWPSETPPNSTEYSAYALLRRVARDDTFLPPPRNRGYPI